uniref:Uncharacterized protein n=1 Tax=Arundo donax TaxID=35708 RepID=A0A0A9C9E4_ARUDO
MYGILRIYIFSTRIGVVLCGG